LTYLVLALLSFFFTTTVQADSRQLALTRIIISETGFQLDQTDEEYIDQRQEARLIAQALRNRSSVGRVTMGIMRQYSPKSFNKERTDNRRWIAHLWTRRARPAHFPANLWWYGHRQRLLEIYEYVGWILGPDHVEAHMCMARTADGFEEVIPDHWGAPVRWLRRMRRRQGWTLLICIPDTKNDFWIM
jgi:hypothetical protein